MMMLKRLAATAAVMFLTAVSGAEMKNLINNSDFEPGDSGFPKDWNMNFHDLKNYFQTAKDPSGKYFLTMHPKSGPLVLHQKDIRLNPGEKYRIGAWIKTNRLKAARSGIVIHDWAWTQSAGTGKLPENTDNWQRIEAEITAPPARHKVYTFAVFAVHNQTGTIQVKSPFLIPVNKKSAENIRPAPEYSCLNLLTPVHPLLSEISVENPFLDISFRYRLPKPEEAYLCRISTRMNGEKNVSPPLEFPLKDQKIHVFFKKLEAGNGILKARLFDKTTKEVIAEAEFPIKVKQKPVISKQGNVRNNFVTELLSAPVRNASYPFSNPRDGWIWIQLSTGKKETKAYLNQNRIPVIRNRPGEAYETMRFLPAGDHAVHLEHTAGGTLAIHSIPEILAFNYPVLHKEAGYQKFHGEFNRNYLVPVINTFNYGYTLPQGALEEMRERGKKWMGLGLFIHPTHPEFTNEYETPEQMSKRFRNHYGVQKLDGIAFDEIFIHSVLEKQLYTQALWRLMDLKNPVYTWSAEVTFAINGLNADYFSAAANHAGGKGKFLFECYARTQPTEQQAQDYLENYLNETIRRAKQLMPGAPAYSMIVNGVYTKLGRYCTDTFPEADVKYFWDMYFRKLAVDADFKDLYGIGIYAYNNGDEENVRWITRLIRHYAIEGRKDSLARRYGFTYLPGHLNNGDFEKGLKAWQVQNAEKDSVRCVDIPNYGLGIQFRQGTPNTTGNTACMFRRSSAAPNKITRTMKGFIPGKLYALRFAVADLDEVNQLKGNYSRFVFSAQLTHAEILTKNSLAAKYDDPVQITKYLNRHTIIWKALQPEVQITFSDWETDQMPSGKPGQRLLLNFIQVKPYYNE